jgi:hypothetical protein
MIDSDGYPEEKDLERIKNWDVLKDGVDGLLELVRENTNWPDRQMGVSGKNVYRMEYHTGGWSGNENVINHLKCNFLFWSLSWVKSTRGGHYYFKINKKQYGW